MYILNELPRLHKGIVELSKDLAKNHGELLSKIEDLKKESTKTAVQLAGVSMKQKIIWGIIGGAAAFLSTTIGGLVVYFLKGP